MSSRNQKMPKYGVSSRCKYTHIHANSIKSSDKSPWSSEIKFSCYNRWRRIGCKISEWHKTTLYSPYKIEGPYTDDLRIRGDVELHYEVLIYVRSKKGIHVKARYTVDTYHQRTNSPLSLSLVTRNTLLLQASFLSATGRTRTATKPGHWHPETRATSRTRPIITVTI
jgi:hypothetical protein